MHLIELSRSHVLSNSVALRRVADFGEKVELLTQARVGWTDATTLVARGPNIDATIRCEADRFTIQFRLGVTWGVAAETVRIMLEQELQLLAEP